MSEKSSRLLLIGASVRAAAASATRAGFEVFAIDRFGDADLQRLATVVPINDWPGNIGNTVQRLPTMPWMYCGSLENEPDLVTRVSQQHRLLGNDPDVLKLIRDPFWVEAVLAARDRPTLRHRSVADAPRNGEWLIKPIRSGGGQGIVVWDNAHPSESEQVYFQEFRRGRSISTLFVAAKCDVQLIGICEQLIGREHGAPTDFGYAGSIGPIAVPDQTRQLIERIGRELAQEARMRGLFGLDFILADDVPWLTEVNPRYTASTEIYERAWGRSLVAEHVRACKSFDDCLTGRSQDFKFHFGHHDPRKVVGKRIVYAVSEMIAQILEVESAGIDDFLADIPIPGSRIAVGWPICTVFASGDDVLAVQQLLEQRSVQAVKLHHCRYESSQIVP